MPARKKRLPSYRLHKPSGRAVVTLDDRVHYLGPHGSPESYDKYKVLVAEWAAANHNGKLPTVKEEDATSDLRISELLLSYLKFAEQYYMKNGKTTGEYTNMNHAVAPLAELYASKLVAQFSPRNLKAVRQKMLDADLSRAVINARVIQPAPTREEVP